MINDQDPHSQVKRDETAGAEIVNSFNSKQREIFNVVHRWSKDYIKHNGQHFEPIHMFFAGSEGRGKFHLVKIIYHGLSKILLYHCKENEKRRFLLPRPTGISAVNILETTIHSRLGMKFGSKLLVVKFLIIDSI